MNSIFSAPITCPPSEQREVIKNGIVSLSNSIFDKDSSVTVSGDHTIVVDFGSPKSNEEKIVDLDLSNKGTRKERFVTKVRPCTMDKVTPVTFAETEFNDVKSHIFGN